MLTLCGCASGNGFLPVRGRALIISNIFFYLLVQVFYLQPRFMLGSNMNDRIDRLFEAVREAVDVVVLSPGETMRYFTQLNMHKSERPTLVFLFRDRDPAMVLPQLETDRVKNTMRHVDLYTYPDATDPVAAAREAFSQLQDTISFSGPVGVEYRSTRLLEESVFGSDRRQLVDVERAVSTVRSRKSEAEVERIQKAVHIVERVLEDVFQQIEPGMREVDVENEIRKRVIDTEAERYGVGIVTSGERTAFAHANTGTRTIRSGEPLMIDAGVVYEGYYSDITRTIAVGGLEPELREIYDVVYDAAAAARERIEPGVEFQEIDRAARAVIENAGYGEYFPHRVGHGLGLEGHEPPYLVEGNDNTLEAGHVVTVEPGIYVPGLGGVRIEDDVVVTDSGANVLTSAPRELRTF